MAELLFLSPHVPYRCIAHDGGRFSWAWLSALSSRNRVHLVTPATPENMSAPRDLPPCVRVTMVPVGPPPHASAARFHDAWNGGITPGIATLAAFRSSSAFAEAVASADLVEIHWQHFLPLANDIRSLRAEVPITAFIHDVMTQKAQREARSARHFRPASDRRSEPAGRWWSNHAFWLGSIKSSRSHTRTVICFGGWG